MRSTTSRWLAVTTGIVAAGMLMTLGQIGAFIAGLICGAIIGAAMAWADRATEREDAFNRGFMYDGPTDLDPGRARYDTLPDPVTGSAAAQPPLAEPSGDGQWQLYGGPLDYDP